jgi:transcriptional regulator with XRE-family HTH domain
MSFDELLRSCREVLGIHAYNVAEFMGITAPRLKTLERGVFCSMPPRHELKMLEKIYDIPEEIWKVKAQDLLDKNVKQKKIRRRYGNGN